MIYYLKFLQISLKQQFVKSSFYYYLILDKLKKEKKGRCDVKSQPMIP
jgi:hypothetical protein